MGPVLCVEGERRHLEAIADSVLEPGGVERDDLARRSLVRWNTREKTRGSVTHLDVGVGSEGVHSLSTERYICSRLTIARDRKPVCAGDVFHTRMGSSSLEMDTDPPALHEKGKQILSAAISRLDPETWRLTLAGQRRPLPDCPGRGPDHLRSGCPSPCRVPR